MPVFAVRYDYLDDEAALDRNRPAHRQFMRTLAADGTLRASGPFAMDGGPRGALLLLRADSADTVRALLADDPLATTGLIVNTVIREWAVGSGEAQPAIAQGA